MLLSLLISLVTSSLNRPSSFILRTAQELGLAWMIPALPLTIATKPCVRVYLQLDKMTDDNSSRAFKLSSGRGSK
eukprot:4974842-Pleurochrysis_carterae.AAC.3